MLCYEMIQLFVYNNFSVKLMMFVYNFFSVKMMFWFTFLFTIIQLIIIPLHIQNFFELWLIVFSKERGKNVFFKKYIAGYRHNFFSFKKIFF